MAEEMEFRFSIQGLPHGQALTGLEMEQKFLAELDATQGTCVDSWWSLATLYQHTGHLDESSSCIQRVVELTKDGELLGAAYLALGQLEESRSNYAGAVKHYRGALALEPCSTQTWYFIHNNLGYSLNQLGEHTSAVPYLQRALEIDPSRPNAYKNLGLSHQALGELEEAAELFITATQVDASDSRSLDHLMALMESHPALEVDVPSLRERAEVCRLAVDEAEAQQVDFQVHWEELRSEQQPKWWQFWKRWSSK